MFEMVQVSAVNRVHRVGLGHSNGLTHILYGPLAEMAEQLDNLIEHQKPKSVQPYVLCPSIADVQQLCAILSVAGVDLARDEREPPAARPRLLDQLLRLLRQARPEEVLSLDHNSSIKLAHLCSGSPGS